jgi:hypothetical protein
MADAVARGATDRAKLQADVEAAVDGLLGDIERLKTGLRLQGIPAGRARMAVGLPDAEALATIEALHTRFGTPAQ